MKLLVVDNNDSFTYNLVQQIEESGLTEITVINHSLIDIEALSEYDKILFSPGPSLPDDFPIMKDILRHYAPSKSILGICMGLQAIAEFYGGELYNLKNVIHGQKHELHITKEDIIFQEVPQNSAIGLYHSWAVRANSIPNDLEVIGVNQNQTVMAIRHKKHDIKAFQFHPESIITEYGEKMIYNWLSS